MRSDWSRRASKLTTAYANRTLLVELETAGQLVLSGAWEPQVTFKQLVRIMLEADLQLAHREAHGRSYVPVQGLGIPERGDGRRPLDAEHAIETGPLSETPPADLTSEGMPAADAGRSALGPGV